MRPTPTHLFLDFFGTVVEYSPSRTAQGYERTHDLMTRMGSTRTFDESLAAWSAAFDRLERETSASLEEFSSHQVAQLALRAILGRAPDAHEIRMSAQSYQDDWSQGIRYPTGMLDVLRQLSGRFTLAIVSNTHDENLVQAHLTAMGARHFFENVITSIDVGRRKPHPVVFETALDTLGVGPADALFVGDTYLTDYVGPRRSGIRAFLIDPARIEHVPAAHRIDSLAKLAEQIDHQGLTSPTDPTTAGAIPPHLRHAIRLRIRDGRDEGR